MFRNYFKIAFRNLWKNKAFSAINILGLSMGIATCLLILLFVKKELSYDRFNKKSDRIYRVTFHGKMQGGDIREAHVMPPVAAAMRTDFPEVEAATRIASVGSSRISYNDQVFKEPMAFADPNIFDVFTLPLVKGNAATALSQPDNAVITESAANKYFGDADPMGKVLILPDQKVSLKVTAVMKDIPENSHFHAGLLASMLGKDDARSPSWMTSGFYTYVLLRKDANVASIRNQLPAMAQRYMGPQLQQSMGLSFEAFKATGNSVGLQLQPLTSIHLESGLSGEFEPSGDIRYVYIFGAVAVFMLVIACINFMNLSTAGASKRAKEIGIRKVMGSARRQLIGQFLLESMLITAIAVMLAIFFVYWLLPFFNSLTGQTLELKLASDPSAWILLIIFGLLTGLLAGSYPAFFLSSFKPVAVLKGRFSSGKKSSNLRSGLVVFQFVISIALIIGTTVVYQQLSFIRNKKLGYEKEQVLVIQETYWLGNNEQEFKRQLLEDPSVVSVSASNYLPAGNSYGNNYLISPDNKSDQLIKSLRYEIDEAYIPTLGMKIAEGRNFSKEYGTDSTAIIINETAAKSFGWEKDALSHSISHNTNEGTRETFRVVGVVKDFHFRSLHEPIAPLVMTMARDHGSMIVKIRTGNIPALLSGIEKKWKNMKAEAPFSWSFLDERFNNTYRNEQHIGKILGIFAGLTIFVACLGLFGLATFTAAQRMKEIGIRKVLGADVSGLVALLSKDFLRLVLVAFIIAAPVAWFVMNQWLRDFAYRISISWWVFVLAAVAAVFIALITVSFQAIRAALANPVNSLRSE